MVDSVATTYSQENAKEAFWRWLTKGGTQDPGVTGPSVSGSGASKGTPALTLSTTNAQGSASTFVATDATIAEFDATVPVTQAFSDAAATGSAGFAARRDHKHGMPATPAGATYYTVSSTSTTAHTDTAGYSDLENLSIASVPAGTYLAVLDIGGSNKTGEEGILLTDGSNTTLWGGTTRVTTRHNADNNIECHWSGVIVLGSTLTVKARGAGISSISNFNLTDRHLTLIKIA